jgi:hypothetical protein
MGAVAAMGARVVSRLGPERSMVYRTKVRLEKLLLSMAWSTKVRCRRKRSMAWSTKEVAAAANSMAAVN